MSAPWILTSEGNQFTFGDPTVKVSINDIAHSLSQLCRWTGHTREIYTVAEHSLRVCSQVFLNSPPEKRVEWALWGLLHDASEAYLGDVSSPLKRYLKANGAGYDELEKTTQKLIIEQLGPGGPMPDLVKHYDEVLLATEARDLLPNVHSDWLNAFPAPLSEPITPTPSVVVERDFLTVYNVLRNGDKDVIEYLYQGFQKELQ